MTKSEFIYQFTKIFLSEAVKETILIENWDETRDFDPRYEEYAKFFLTMKNKYPNFSDKDIIETLTNRKNDVVHLFKKEFRSRFEKELIKRSGCTKEIANHLIQQEDIFLVDSINVNALKKFRELEEKILNTSKGDK